MSYRRPPLPAIALAFGILATAACSPIVNTRGNIVEPDRLAQIKAGESTADDVLTILGTPTSVGTFDTRSWYYIGQVTERTAFFVPEVAERKVVAIHFDPGGKVVSVKELDKTAGQDVALVERTTPTAGHEMGIVEQLLGNVGKFNPAQKQKGGPGSVPGQR